MSRIGLIGENSIGYVDKLLDIWNNGDCAVLIDWRIPFNVAIEMVKIITFECFNQLADIIPEKIAKKYKPNYNKNESLVLYSSGTTRKSKGIILTHYAINTNSDAIIDYMKPTPRNCMVVLKTFSHSLTITGELLAGLKSGMRLVIVPTIVPPRHILNNIEKFGVSLICLNPALLYLICDEVNRTRYALKMLKEVYVSGAILSDKVYEKAQAILYKTQMKVA